MTVLLVLLLIAAMVGALAYFIRAGQRPAHPAPEPISVPASRSPQQPVQPVQQATQAALDPILDEVFVRPADARRRRIAEADAAVRSEAPHILRMTRERGASPLLIIHSKEIMGRGLLVVTTDDTLHFDQGRMTTIGHRSATNTKIMTSGGGNVAWVEIRSEDGRVDFGCESLEQARDICATIDPWVNDPTVRSDPRVLITRRRVYIPDEFFIDTLRTAGYPITPYNMRSIHERFGMMFINKARKLIDKHHSLVAGEKFTTMYGRPFDDADLPSWPATILQGWIELDPAVASKLAFYVPHIRDFMLETARSGGYLAHPDQPLSMWKAEWYEDDGRGARRAIGPNQSDLPGVPA